MSVQLAYALLCFLFFAHNRSLRKDDEIDTAPQLSSPVFHDQPYDMCREEVFGITSSPTSNDQQFWGTKEVMTTSYALESLDFVDTEDDDDDFKYVSLEEARSILIKIMHTLDIHHSLESLLPRSPLFNHELGLFTSQDLNKLFDTSTGASLKQHNDRLEKVIHVCELRRIDVKGDGNCCFGAVSLALKELPSTVNTASLPINVLIGLVEITASLRKLAVEEWNAHPEYYQQFLVHTNIAEE